MAFRSARGEASPSPDSTETQTPDRRTPPTMRTFKDTDLFGDINAARVTP